MTEQDMWLWLSMAFGPANPRKWNILEHFGGSISDCYETVSSGGCERLLPQDKNSVADATPEKLEALKKTCEKHGIKICAYSDPDYPENLKEIYNPPAVLFYTGDISCLNGSLVITVVGTRKPSEYSVGVCKSLCTGLAKSGVCIASGFAVGSDSLSHRSAILAGGRTVAVLPCGHLHPYPKENTGAGEVISKRGAVISEYFPNFKPNHLSFKARNRILSGIRSGVLISQAGIGSGSLSTASFAVSQGRDIFCIPPHDILDPKQPYAGVYDLIRSGAVTVFSAADVLQAYPAVFPNSLPAKGKLPPKQRSLKKAPAENERAGVEEPKRPANLVPSPIVPPEELGGKKLEIFNYLKEHGETHLDQLAVGVGDVFELEAYITELELDGLIELLPGNRLRLI